MIRVLIVDDQALMRAGFRALLEAEDGIEVVGEAADGRRGVELVRRYTPDVALIDVQMPVMTGIEATREIAADPLLAAVHVVILTNYGLDEYVFDALRAGAAGFLLKDTEPAELLRAIEVAARGDALLSPAITRRLIGAFVSRPPDRATAPGLEALTRREREVTALAARGLTNEEIAAHMVISPFTAKTHISRAMIKLGARDRAQLVVFAYESGLVEARRPPGAQGSAPSAAGRD
ncbi:response regulator [Streptomyces sp. NBC_00887]|uniref:response regulator n=1 Tax=Streptomyces sp. NBC_00887 TaxID=2975859 RepID=UPI00386BB85C|nr:response regulator transcription factor [Streptomyces sp. NBC_00887]